MGAIQGHYGMLLNVAAGGGLPPLANSDDFSTNTISSYTTNGGSWSVSGGSMNCTGATAAQATCVRNGFSAANAKVEADFTDAEDAGLLLRFVDNNNYYLVAIADDTSSAVPASQNLRIFKRVSGTFTQLGSSIDLTWVSPSARTIRFTATGTTLEVYVNGALAASVTDSSISSAGAVGMRCNAADSFLALRWE